MQFPPIPVHGAPATARARGHTDAGITHPQARMMTAIPMGFVQVLWAKPFPMGGNRIHVKSPSFETQTGVGDTHVTASQFRRAHRRNRHAAMATPRGRPDARRPDAPTSRRPKVQMWSRRCVLDVCRWAARHCDSFTAQGTSQSRLVDLQWPVGRCEGSLCA